MRWTCRSRRYGQVVRHSSAHACVGARPLFRAQALVPSQSAPAPNKQGTRRGTLPPHVSAATGLVIQAVKAVKAVKENSAEDLGLRWHSALCAEPSVRRDRDPASR